MQGRIHLNYPYAHTLKLTLKRSLLMASNSSSTPQAVCSAVCSVCVHQHATLEFHKRLVIPPRFKNTVLARDLSQDIWLGNSLKHQTACTHSSRFSKLTLFTQTHGQSEQTHFHSQSVPHAWIISDFPSCTELNYSDSSHCIFLWNKIFPPVDPWGSCCQSIWQFVTVCLSINCLLWTTSKLLRSLLLFSDILQDCGMWILPKSHLFYGFSTT